MCSAVSPSGFAPVWQRIPRMQLPDQASTRVNQRSFMPQRGGMAAWQHGWDEAEKSQVDQHAFDNSNYRGTYLDTPLGHPRCKPGWHLPSPWHPASLLVGEDIHGSGAGGAQVPATGASAPVASICHSGNTMGEAPNLLWDPPRPT